MSGAAASAASAAVPAQGKLPTRLAVFHGLGSAAYGIKDNGFSTFLLIFYSQVIGMDAKLVSLALMLALVIDAFIDPVIGHLSDRTYTRFGRRHPWLYGAAVPLGLAWLLLWTPPSDPSLLFPYLVVVAVVVRALISCCEVPSQSLVAELTGDYDERTRLVRFRHLFAWGGGLLLFFLANTVFLRADEEHQYGQLNPDGYWHYGLTGGVLMTAFVLISALGQHSRVAHLPAARPEPTSPLKALREIIESLRHPAALILLGGAAVAISSSQMTFALSNYLYLYVWRFSETSFALLPWLLMAGVLASFVIVQPLHRHLGKRMTAVVCAMIGVVFWVAPYVMRFAGVWPEPGSAASAWLMFAFVLVSNVNAVMVTISAQSMLADVVEASQEATGRRTEGVFSAGWMFVQKCATAMGIGMTGLLVSYSGLPRKAIPGQVDAIVIDRLTLSYCIIVVLAAALSTLIFSRFPITRADHEARLAALSAARINPDAEGMHP